MADNAGGAAKLAVPVLLIYLLCSWVVALGGLSAVTDKLPSYTVSLQWFVLILQLLLIIAIPLLAISGALRRLSLALVAFFAILSTLMLTFAQTAYISVRTTSGIDSQLNAWIAGVCLLFIGNIAAILLLSLDGDSDKALITMPTKAAKGAAPAAPAGGVSMPVSAPTPGTEVV